MPIAGVQTTASIPAQSATGSAASTAPGSFLAVLSAVPATSGPVADQATAPSAMSIPAGPASDATTTSLGQPPALIPSDTIASTPVAAALGAVAAAGGDRPATGTSVVARRAGTDVPGIATGDAVATADAGAATSAAPPAAAATTPVVTPAAASQVAPPPAVPDPLATAAAPIDGQLPDTGATSARGTRSAASGAASVTSGPEAARGGRAAAHARQGGTADAAPQATPVADPAAAPASVQAVPAQTMTTAAAPEQPGTGEAVGGIGVGRRAILATPGSDAGPLAEADAATPAASPPSQASSQTDAAPVLTATAVAAAPGLDAATAAAQLSTPGGTTAPVAMPAPIAAKAPAAASAPAAQLAPALVAMRPNAAGQQSLMLRLTPAELGTVQVEVTRAHDGTAAVTVTAERPETLQMLQHDHQQLSHALDSAGIPSEGRSLSFDLASGGSLADGGRSGGQSGAGSQAGAEGGQGGSQGMRRAWQQGWASDSAETGLAAAQLPAGWQRAGVNITA